MGIKNQQGFSLIETIVATSVLSAGLLGLIGMFGAGYSALNGGESRTLASKLARDQMEKLRSIPAALTPLSEEALPNGMKRAWSVAKDPADANMWVVTVEVTWKNLQNKTRTIEIKSFRSS
ncbi:MAG: prepilin-type N-terminal cleavage/methylation domain-containing protein [Nitrospiria bacterium]